MNGAAQAEALITILITTAALILWSLVLIVILKRCLILCRPDELWALTGRAYRLPGGSTTSVRVLSGGRRLRLPVIERASRLDASALPIELGARGCYAKGGVPMTISGFAVVKVSRDPHLSRDAVERFLGRETSEIALVAQQTLEGNLRELVATVEPEPLFTERLTFADRLRRAAARDLAKLGLEVDALTMTTVNDEEELLSSRGREVIAKKLREAELADHNAVAGYRDAPGQRSLRRPPPKGRPAPKPTLGTEPPRPRSVTVISGRVKPDDPAGHQLSREGAFALPFIEARDLFDVTPMILDLELSELQTKVSVPVRLRLLVEVFLGEAAPGEDQRRLEAAVGRLLRKPRSEIEALAEGLIHGVVSGVIATMTPEEVRDDGEHLQRALLEELDESLEPVGLGVGALELVEVSDPVGYFEALERLERLR